MRSLFLLSVLMFVSPAYAKDAVVEAKAAIRDALKDPDSAKFKGVFVNPATKAVCGEVNAKTPMGGYMGYRKFYWLPGDTFIAQIARTAAGQSVWDDAWNAKCRR